MGIFSKFRKGLKKTRTEGITAQLDDVMESHQEITDDLYDELEEVLIMGDVGIPTAQRVIRDLKAKIENDKITSVPQVRETMKDIVSGIVWGGSYLSLRTKPSVILVIGVNGVGKTTILDALRYCLTTSKSFNALGNRKSKRTLLGSVHGKQRDQDGDRPRYSRKGHTVSYVGAEFRDDTAAPGKDTFVITVRVESEKPDEDMRHVQQRWYISPRGVMLEDLPFLGPDYIPTKREQFCPKNGKMRDTDNQKLAKDLICRALGIGAADSPLGKKFCAVFPMGTGMDDIEDFREFIYHYILPQPEIDPQALQQEQIELDHLNDVLLQAKERAQLLTEIGTIIMVCAFDLSNCVPASPCSGSYHSSAAVAAKFHAPFRNRGVRRFGGADRDRKHSECNHQNNR